MDIGLTNKVIVVSGGAGIRGSIGQTLVTCLGQEGAIPVIVDRNARGFTYAQELQEQGIDGLFVQTDMTQPEQIEAAVQQIGEKYGRIDGLINNVGVNDGVNLESSYDEFIQSLKLNLASYFMLTKCALPYLKRSKGPILNIGSKVALTGQGGTSGYAASKGGVLGLTREWAVDLIRYDIRVNSLIIAESWTPAYQQWLDTLEHGEEKLQSIVRKIPLQNRMTTPEEIANTSMFILSDLSSHTTGQFIFVDGGYVHLDRALLPQEE